MDALVHNWSTKRGVSGAPSFRWFFKQFNVAPPPQIGTQLTASAIVRDLRVDLYELPDDLRLAALSLAARAVREASLLYIHKLTSPAKQYEAYDAMFGPAPSVGQTAASSLD